MSPQELAEWKVVIRGQWTFETNIVVAANAEGLARHKALELVRNSLPWGAGDAELEITKAELREGE